MVSHGTYKLADEATVRFQNAVATFDSGHPIRIVATDATVRKQCVDFGDGMIDWFCEGNVERWVGVDTTSAGAS